MKFYVIGFIAIGLCYAVHSYTVMGRFLLENVPRERSHLYRDCPILFIVAFGVSFLPKGWALIIGLVLLGINLYIGLKVIKQKYRLIDFSKPSADGE